MKSKNLSKKILRLIKSKGFKNIELDPVLETNIFYKDQEKILENIYFLFTILMGGIYH